MATVVKLCFFGIVTLVTNSPFAEKRRLGRLMMMLLLVRLVCFFICVMQDVLQNSISQNVHLPVIHIHRLTKKRAKGKGLPHFKALLYSFR